MSVESRKLLDVEYSLRGVHCGGPRTLLWGDNRRILCGRVAAPHFPQFSVLLPEAARSVRWCPWASSELGVNDEDVAFATLGGGTPLQLRNADDGNVRASYTAFTTMGTIADARSLSWARTEQVIVGYGEGGAPTVAAFDVMREGAAPLWTYNSKVPGVRSTIVFAVEEFESLVLCGSSGGFIEAADRRTSTPALLLRQHQSAVTHVKVVDSSRYMILTASRKGDGKIRIWDLRRPTSPCSGFSRVLKTHQHAAVICVGKQIVAATHESGGRVVLARIDDESAGVVSMDVVPTEDYVCGLDVCPDGLLVLTSTRAGWKRIRSDMEGSDDDMTVTSASGTMWQLPLSTISK